MKKYNQFIKENSDIDPYNEEQWDDNVVFNKKDVQILTENGFDIIPYQYDDDEDWDEEQSAIKHMHIGKDFCRVEITKVNSDPIRYFLHVSSLGVGNGARGINYNDYELEKTLYNLKQVIDRKDLWHIKSD